MPPSACSKRPELRRIGAGEGALLVAEQFGFDQVARYRRHVDRDERSGAALAVVVQRARHQFLAGAGLARDHDRQVGLHQARQDAIDFLHRRRAADQRNGFEVLDLGRRPWFFLRLRQRAADDRGQLLEVEWLRQIFVSAALGGANCGHERVLRAHDDDRQIRPRLFDPRQQIEGAFVGQQHVGDDEIAVALTDPAPQRGRVSGRADFITGARQRLIEHRPDRRIIIGDENASRGHQ